MTKTLKTQPNTSDQQASGVPSVFKIGLVQMCSGRDVEANVRAATTLIREAAASGARYVQTPEMTTLMELERDRLLLWTRPEEGNPSLAHFRALARELKLWLHIGSMGIAVGDGKLANRAYLISPQGAIAAKYDKIHMFDVDLPSGESYKESRRFVPGTQAVVAALPWGGLGISICYDMRFPQLYRALAKGGADFLTMPSAFTRQTGEAHWELLLRARAVEAQCYVFAAAQCGRHENGRETYGHSLVVDPWGTIVAKAGGAPQVLLADIDPAMVTGARSRLPSLTHDRPFHIKGLVNDPSHGTPLSSSAGSEPSNVKDAS